MKPWTREDTKFWISQLENRVSDISYYLHQTAKWCEDHFIHDDRKVFMCNFLTCVWVCHMRNEEITYKELLEILGLEDFYTGDDSVYSLGKDIRDVEHDELLSLIIRRLEDI